MMLGFHILIVAILADNSKKEITAANKSKQCNKGQTENSQVGMSNWSENNHYLENVHIRYANRRCC